MIWGLTTNFKTDAPALNTPRSEAETLARQTLSERGAALPAPWRVLSSVQAQPDQQDRFVWQNGGKENYQKLLGQYLSPPHWKIRFANFEGDVAERAEEYQVFIAGNGSVLRVRHQLPEARPGDSLSVEAAREIAHSVVKEKYRLEPASLKEISAVASKRPARQDWTFEFSDTLNYPLEQGEARLAVEIAGNQLVDAYRYLHVPEEWARQERNQRNLPNLIGIACTVLVVLLIIAGAIGAVVACSRKNFSARTFWSFWALIFGLNLIGFVNGWPSVTAQFSTAQPWQIQTLIFAGAGLISALLVAVALALIIGFVQNWRSQRAQIEISKAASWGFALGILAMGLLAAATFLAPSLKPSWAQYGAAGTFLPLLEASLDPLGRFIMQTALLLLVFTAVDRFTNGWTRKQVLFSALVVLLGVIFAGARSVETLPFWLVSGLATGVVLLLAYIFVLRFNLALVPAAVATMIILSELKQGMAQPVPAAFPGAIIAIILTALLAFYWLKKLATEPA